MLILQKEKCKKGKDAKEPRKKKTQGAIQTMKGAKLPKEGRKTNIARHVGGFGKGDRKNGGQLWSAEFPVWVT